MTEPDSTSVWGWATESFKQWNNIHECMNMASSAWNISKANAYISSCSWHIKKPRASQSFLMVWFPRPVTLKEPL